MRLLSVLTAILISTAASADTFEGTIVNTKGKAQKDVVVMLKGSRASVSSDKHGDFVIPITSSKDTIVIVNTLDKLAYFVPGEARNAKFILDKKEFTVETALDTITSPYTIVQRKHKNPNLLTREDIMMRGAHTLYEALRGSIPGVNVSFGANGQQMVTVRGVGTFYSSPEPLFIIDGVEYDRSSDANNAIAVEEIETIEVNKTGAGYGVKGGNGVIIITRTNSSYYVPMSSEK